MFLGAIAFAGVIAALIAYGRWWNLHGGGKFLREKNERRKADREASVKARGWNYDGTIDGNIHYRISGVASVGTPWLIQYDSDQSSSSSTPRLSFIVAALAAPEYRWIIHDKPTYDVVQKRMIKAVIGGIVSLVGAFSDAMKIKRDFFERGRDLRAGSAEFRGRYVLASTDSRWAALLDSEIERGILAWPPFKQTMSRRDNCVSAELTPQGLCVHVYCDAPEMAVIEHMAKLGQRLTEKCLQIDAPASPPRESSNPGG